VTFFFLLALFPALSAFVSLYGLIADAADAQRQIAGLAGLMPGGAIKVLSDNLQRLANTNSGGLSLAFAVSLAVSVWSANSGVKALIAGLNVAYEAKERRGFIRLNLVSLAFTVGAIALAVVMLGVVVVAPAILGALQLDPDGGFALLRWPLLFVLVAGLLAVLYRFAPSRAQPQWRWITPGGGFAALAWIAMSALFSWYVENVGHYDRTYGSLGAIVGFLTWVWLSLMVVMIGAELNAALEARAGADRDPGHRPEVR
jgi:membrane protein